MAITKHIEDEFNRTIDEIRDYYDRFSDDVNDYDEMEHRIQRMERLKEACNGLSKEEKLQKTAENLFEVGSSWERGSDSIKKLIFKNQKHIDEELDKIQSNNNKNYQEIKDSIKEISTSVNKKLDETQQYNEKHFMLRNDDIKEKSSTSLKGKIISFIDTHFTGVAIWTITILIIIFISGHTNIIEYIIQKI